MSAAISPPPQGRCPQCRKPSSLAKDNPWRPFCCERCKLIDLGAWIEGSYRIAALEDDDALDAASTEH